MTEYTIGSISLPHSPYLAQIDRLLATQNIHRDPHLDYLCALFDEKMEIIGVGGCVGNTLRCLAVSDSHQGEGLMSKIITHLINLQSERGNVHLFLYTKPDAAMRFQELGFYEIIRTPLLVFLENKRNGFQQYLQHLKTEDNATLSLPMLTSPKKVAAIVMNANPFTLGHLFLVEKAAKENDIVHLFMVSEDKSLIPFAIRKQLILAGTQHLSNLRYHDSGSYIISSATFPSYFQESENDVIISNAQVDLQIFTQIATALGIQKRYVGDEPFSRVTHLYNQIMQQKLPEQQIECEIVPRKMQNGVAISASAVRKAIQQGNLAAIKPWVPETTWAFLHSPAGTEIIQHIQQAEQVEHY